MISFFCEQGVISTNTRIKAIRKYADLTQEEFGARIGIKQNSVALIESGKRNPSTQLVLAICREFGISRHWLETGEGDMMDTGVEQSIELLTRAMEGNSSAKSSSSALSPPCRMTCLNLWSVTSNPQSKSRKRDAPGSFFNRVQPPPYSLSLYAPGARSYMVSSKSLNFSPAAMSHTYVVPVSTT